MQFLQLRLLWKAYIVSVIDAVLWKNIRRYSALVERQNPLNEKALKEIAYLKTTNLKRAAELRQMHIREG